MKKGTEDILTCFFFFSEVQLFIHISSTNSRVLNYLTGYVTF